MTLVSDNFQRADGSLGGAWGTIGSCTDNQAINPGPYNGSIILKNHAFAPSDSGSDVALCPWSGASFGNDQFASAQISAIADYTSQVAITACSASAGVSTYTYTLSAGAALIVNQQIYVTAMTNSGNNSPTAGFKITVLGAGTFSVANASPGANESGSSGLGKSPSDSNCGVAVRVSSDGKTGYMIQVGTNSGAASGGGVAVDHRVYDVELWKMNNGIGTSLALYKSGQLTSIPDSVGDIYTLAVFGTTLTMMKNGVVLLQATDSSIASGSPGIGTWTIGGAGEWANPSVYLAGNSGTQWTNFVGGDGVTNAGSYLVYSDNFTRANSGNLGANWTTNPSTDVALQVSSNTAQATSPNVINGDYYSAASPALPADQYSEATLVALNSTSLLIPTIRQSNSAQTRYYFIITGPIGSSAHLALYRVLAGTQVQLGATLTSQTISSGQVFRISVRGTTITCYQNGVQKIQQTDANIASGFTSLILDPVTNVTNATVSLWSGSASLGTITGNAGIAGALVSYTGNTAGMVIADGSGNYTITVPTGAYVITPILAGEVFSPSSSSQTLADTDLSGVNFTASTATGAVGNAGSLSLRRRKRRDVIS